MALGILFDDTTGQSYDPNDATQPTPTAPAAPSNTSYSIPGGVNWDDVIARGGVTGQAIPNAPWMSNANTPSSQGQSGGGNYGSPIGYDAQKLNDPTHQTDKYQAARIQMGGGDRAAVLAALGPRYRAHGSDSIIDTVTGDIIDLWFDFDNASGQRRPQWTITGNINGSGGSGSAAGGGTGGGGSSAPANPFASAQTGNQFSDPVTQEWEGMLRQLVDKLNTPQPMWSNSQLDLMQTQALDPMERQRQQQKLQAGQRLSARGITPGSGIFESAMADIDRQFDQMRTQTQAGFATNAVNREDQLFHSNEQRNVNAVNAFKQIPQYADTRLQLAMNALTPSNPYQLLALQNDMTNQAQNRNMYQQMQQQQFWESLMKSLAPLLG